MHYQDIKNDPEGEITKLAQFLGYDPKKLDIKKIVEKSSFDYMKKNQDKILPTSSVAWKKGNQTFLNQGLFLF